MASITQHIPSYVQGISEQPDELKVPGQLRDALNVLPDVTKGLLKRPGARLVNPIDTVQEGKWFHIYRDSEEQYIGHIAQSGDVKIFSTFDGMPRVVRYQSKPYARYPDPIGDDVTETRPGWATCDTDALDLAVSEYRKAKSSLDQLRRDIDAVQVKIENLNNDNGIVSEHYEVQHIGRKTKVLVGAVGFTNSLKPLRPASVMHFGYPSVDTNQFTVEIVQPPKENGQYTISPDNRDLGVNHIYAYVVRRKAGIVNSERDTLTAEKKALEAQLPSREAAMNSVRKTFELAAAACGIYSDPTTRRLQPRNAAPTDVLQYLRHSSPEQLQVLTVNDYTFISNREVITSMSEASLDQRPYEAYISLSQIAYNKQYSLNFYSDSASQPTEVSGATRLDLLETAWEGDATCSQIGIETFDYNHPTDPTKRNLRFNIEVRGQSVPRSTTDPYQGYICKYTASVDLIFGGEGWVKGDVITVDMPGARKFTVTVSDNSTSFIQADIGAVRPQPTPSSPTTLVTAESILDDLKVEIEKIFAFTATKIGNGLYVTGYKPFSISTSEEQLMNVFTTQVNNVARLPQQCRDGYIVKVVNSANNEDDYYLKFISHFPGVDGEGVWEETTRPGQKNTINAYSMPHQIVRLADGSFVVSPVEWDPRQVGDNITNPFPTFIGKTINNIAFFRNRLVLLSDENIIMSRPGDFFNFWAKTAMTVTAADVIDISVASTYPAVLYEAIEVNAGLLLFSPTQQFLLTTDNDVLSPETAKVNSISSYRFNEKTYPVSMGVTVGFLNNAGMNARFFEMTNIRREGEAEVLEQSKPISEKLPADMNLLADSKENNLMMAGTFGLREVWGYRYFNSGEKRIQSAWFRWELTGALVYHCIMDDVYYAVLHNITEAGQVVITLQRFDLKNTVWTAIVEDDELYPYTVHMDNYRVVLPSELQYYPDLKQTHFRLPIGYYADKRLAAYTLKRGKFQGRAAYPKVEVDSLGTWAVFEGDWSDTRLMIGYEFTMDVTFPTIYLTQESGDKSRSDTRASLIVQRIKLNLGPVGVYETTLKRKGRPDYTELYESREEDGYRADAVAFVSEVTQTVPCYERNVNLSIHLSSNHPSPATLYSMTWEGDYSPMYYKRV